MGQLMALFPPGKGGGEEVAYPSSVTLGNFDQFASFQLTKNQGFNPV
jgi:hypothetical protein